MRQCDDVEVACRRCEDVNLAHNGFDVRHLEALHARLQGADGIDLGHDDTGTRSPQGEGAALANIAISTHPHTPSPPLYHSTPLP